MKRREFMSVAATIAFVPTPVNDPYKDAEYVQGLADRLVDAHHLHGGVPLAATALRHVRKVKEAIGGEGHGLKVAASNLARSASLALWDAQQVENADHVGRMALVLARRANYVEGISHCFENLCVFTTLRDPVRAAHYAQSGLRSPGVTPEHEARLNARLGVALSWRTGGPGANAGASRTAIDRARAIDGLPPVANAVIAANAALSLASLRRYAEADAAFAAALGGFGDNPLLHATWLTQRIKASLRAGAYPAAADQAGRLAAVAPLVDSARLDRHLAEITTMIGPRSEVPELREARDRLRAVMPSRPA
ncbi:hypothetical protein [Actinomadura roseirufa]|uniref:hypothetical protein n=1 Tax=Actinomadura roseirufa TaxID=2094049 RepID=UPI00104100D9|nr:hypothetical protein [Actinomadura roseirufa]